MAMRTWVHGEKPTAAMINAFKADLDAAYESLGDYAWNVGCKTESSAVFHLVHGRRYLHYGSSGTLVDIFGVNDDVSLSSSSGWGTLDLDGLGWLSYGTMYKVTGVSWAIEDGDA
jgi:hypothetical protein